MASVNRVHILGNVGRDPELRYTPSGTAVCSLSVATSRSWKNKDSGEKQEETEWHRIAFYDRLAEIAGEYLRKGSSVYVEGRLKTRKWQDKEGKDQYTTEVIAEQMQLLGSRDEPKAADRGMEAKSKPAAKPKSGGFDSMDDLIPFADPLKGAKSYVY